MNFKKVTNSSNDTRELYEGYALITNCEIKTSKKTRLSAILNDSSGKIDAVMWDPTQTFENKTVVYVRGTYNTYNGSPQFQLEQIRNIREDESVDVSTLIPSVSQNPEELYEKCLKYADSLEDEDYSKLCTFLLKEHREKFLVAPAAIKLHHALRGGLLLHILTMAEVANKICEIYPVIDKSLLISGALLHDIGKLYEIDYDDYGLADSYTTDGQLVGHLVRGANIIRTAGKKMEIKESKIRLLEHMILSHHGVPEYGAAVLPKTLEAYVLSAIDNLDATIYEFVDALKDVAEKDFSSNLWFLENRKIYRPEGFDPTISPKV
ncbi:MAG: HD domain-containing protein [Clostridia bacterium]|nr:HD domain-containing protein [Clostridia bacterium]